MTLTGVIFYLLTAAVILSGVLVVTLKNPIDSVVALVSCFVNSAAIFILLEMNLIGLIYIIVYVGAIAILFIFVIMMMDLRNQAILDSDQLIDKSQEIERSKIGGRNSHYPLALIITGLFILFQTNYIMGTELSDLSNLVNGNSDLGKNYLISDGPGIRFILNDYTTWQIASVNVWDSLLISRDLIHSVGYVLYTDFLSLLLLASLILLMVMVGVIALIKTPETKA